MASEVVMVKTYGLTHLSLSVRDPSVSLAFCQAVFGVEEYYRDESSIQVKGPGPHDILAFERRDAAGQRVGSTISGFA